MASRRFRAKLTVTAEYVVRDDREPKDDKKAIVDDPTDFVDDVLAMKKKNRRIEVSVTEVKSDDGD